MGYEKAFTIALGNMLLENQWPAKITVLPTKGATPNHLLLSHACRVAYCLHDPATKEAVPAAEVKDATSYLIDQPFMTFKDSCEELTPSHSQWWLTGVLGLRLACLQMPGSGVAGVADLLQATGLWLLWHQSLCKLFETPIGIVAPGARAWPPPGPGKEYKGTNSARDRVYQAIATGSVKKTWNPWNKNLDMVSVTFAKVLLEKHQDLFGGAAKADQVPAKLHWPIAVYRDDHGFTGYLTTIENNLGLRTQRSAAWFDGQPSYGFDDAPDPKTLPRWKDAHSSILGGVET
jgi:hypothetical protein